MKPELPAFDPTGLGGKVAVLMGGTAAEREISLQSGRAVMAALEAMRVDAVAIDSVSGWVSSLEAEKPAFAFIAVHGRGGEDGVLQATLESLGVPYSGSGVLGSALAMDKIRSKAVWRGVGVATAEFEYVDASFNGDLKNIFDSFAGPVFVKPASEGSSYGLSIVREARHLPIAVEQARKFDNSVLIERYIDGPEYTVAMLDGVELPSIRIETSREFYNYDAKYIDDDTRYCLPSGLSEQEEAEIQQLSRKAFAALGCSGWGRVDFMRDRISGEFYVLEVNTVPGLTDHSLVPKAAHAVGIDFQELVGGIINVSIIANSEPAIV